MPINRGLNGGGGGLRGLRAGTCGGGAASDVGVVETSESGEGEVSMGVGAIKRKLGSFCILVMRSPMGVAGGEGPELTKAVPLLEMGAA